MSDPTREQAEALYALLERNLNNCNLSYDGLRLADLNGITAALQAARNAAQPVVSVDDGTLTIHWPRAGIAILIVAEEATYSIKPEGGYYGTGAKEFRLADGLPDELCRALKDTTP